MIHKKRNGIRESFTTRFKRGSICWGIGLVILLCLICTNVSHWGMEQLSLGSAGMIRLVWRNWPSTSITNVTTDTSPGPDGKHG